MSLAYQEFYTYEDYKNWEDDWELIEGMPYARRDEVYKFKIYEEEDVKFLGLIYSNDLVAKIYKNENGKFQKIEDFTNEKFDFEIYGIKVDFDNVFKKLRK